MVMRSVYVLLFYLSYFGRALLVGRYLRAPLFTRSTEGSLSNAHNTRRMMDVTSMKQLDNPYNSPTAGTWKIDSNVEDTRFSMFVQMYEDGSAHTAKFGDQDEGGAWRIKEGEFQLSITVKQASGMREVYRYVGSVPDKSYSTEWRGSVMEGQMDPFVVGSFRMRPVQAEMADCLRNAAAVTQALKDRTTKPVYSKKALSGPWLLVHLGDKLKSYKINWEIKQKRDSVGATFLLFLNENGTFSSTQGMGLGHLAGRWNTWDSDKFILTIVRVKSTGAEMTADHSYWGFKITGDGVEPQKIEGEIMYGYLEPCSIGKFIMMRPSLAGKEE